MPQPMDIKLRSAQTHTRLAVNPFMLSLVARKQVLMEEMDTLEDVEESIHEAAAGLSKAGQEPREGVETLARTVDVEELLEVEAPAKLRAHDETPLRMRTTNSSCLPNHFSNLKSSTVYHT